MELAEKIKKNLCATDKLSVEFSGYLKSVLRKEIVKPEEESGSEGAHFNSLVIVLLEAAKNGLDKSQLDSTLLELGVMDEARQVLANCYEEARSQMTVMLSGVGLIAPQLLGLRWKLELIEQDSLLGPRGELLYTIEMDVMIPARIDERGGGGNDSVRKDTIVFHSTKLELLNLLSALKDTIHRVKNIFP